MRIWKIFSCPLTFFPRSTSKSKLRWSFLNVNSSRQHISIQKKIHRCFCFSFWTDIQRASLTGIKICCDIKWCQVTMTREGESEYSYTHLYIYTRGVVSVSVKQTHMLCTTHCEASKHTHTHTHEQHLNKWIRPKRGKVNYLKSKNSMS